MGRLRREGVSAATGGPAVAQQIVGVQIVHQPTATEPPSTSHLLAPPPTLACEQRRRAPIALAGSGNWVPSNSRDIRATRDGKSRVLAVNDGRRKPPLTCANTRSVLVGDVPGIT